ncbi:MAG: hypothetical protein CMO77_02475 [Verrucomicrobiales bacterium]|nr:hypothetical protein [Verrucomicrobiales bacterium]
MKNTFIVILGLVAVYFAYLQFGQQENQNNANVKNFKQRKTTAEIEARDINFSVTVAGEISPAEKVSVRPEVNGKIAELAVDISDFVAKGELLFRLDDKDIQIEIDSRKKQIDSANLQLAQAKKEYERSEQLFEDDLVSKEVFEATKNKYELSVISKDRAQNDYDLTAEKLSKTSVVAPFDCTVLSRPVSIGQAVSGSGGQSGGTEVMEVADLKNLIILSHVNQADVSRMKKNQNVSIEIEAVADLVVQGTVERVAPQATIKSGIKGFSTRIKLLDTDSRVIPGMTATINIPVADSKGVVGARLAAIFTERNEAEQKTETYAYVKNAENDTFVKQMIEVGVNDLNYAEVLRGLKIGDVVSLEKPDDEKVTETITLDGKKIAVEEKKEDPLAKYDTNGNGKLDMEEFRNIDRDKLTDEEKTALREQMRKMMSGRSGGSGRPGGSGRSRGSGRPGGSGRP